MNESRLFVGNLAYQTLENDLQEYFSQAGVVTSVNLMMDKFTGKSRGFAFIEFSTPEEAINAVEMFHSKEFRTHSDRERRASEGRSTAARQRRLSK